MGQVTKELVEQLLADANQATCPACGSVGFYDNRNSPKRGKGPSFKCKNKDCDDGKGYGFGVFDREIKKLAPDAPAANGKGPATAKSPVSWAQIAKGYDECVKLALHEAGRIAKTGVPVHAPDIAAMAANLLVTRREANCWPTLDAEKEAPAPVPAPAKRIAVPPPKQEPTLPDEEMENELPF